MIKQEFDLARKAPPFHQGPTMVQLLAPGLAADARRIVKAGVDFANVQAIRHVALQRVMDNPGARPQVLLPREQQGYIASMTRLPAPDPKILISVVKPR